MPTDRDLITLSDLVRRAAAIVDPPGEDPAVEEFAVRFEDVDEPVRSQLDGLEERILWGVDEDAPIVMAQAVTLYLAHRLDLARGQGATDAWVASEDIVQRVLDETGGYGADYTIEATGLVHVMRQAVESARMGWGLCTVAGVAGKGETLDIVPRYLIQGRRVAGSSFGGVKGRDQVPQLVQRYLDGELDVDPFISHRITLDEVNRGFELMHAQDGIRSVIEFS